MVHVGWDGSIARDVRNWYVCPGVAMNCRSVVAGTQGNVAIAPRMISFASLWCSTLGLPHGVYAFFGSSAEVMLRCTSEGSSSALSIRVS